MRIVKRAVIHASTRSRRGCVRSRNPPYYAAEIRPCLVALTCCGLRIDANAQVLSQKGEPISGLFAAGETTGGVLRQYGGSGNSIASALVFGRRAGRAVGALVKGES